jgi:hypothetical protein
MYQSRSGLLYERENSIQEEIIQTFSHRVACFSLSQRYGQETVRTIKKIKQMNKPRMHVIVVQWKFCCPCVVIKHTLFGSQIFGGPAPRREIFEENLQILIRSNLTRDLSNIH